MWQVRSSKPSPHPFLAQDTQITIVGATIPNSVLKKIEKIVPVCMFASKILKYYGYHLTEYKKDHF